MRRDFLFWLCTSIKQKYFLHFILHLIYDKSQRNWKMYILWRKNRLSPWNINSQDWNPGSPTSKSKFITYYTDALWVSPSPFKGKAILSSPVRALCRRLSSCPLTLQSPQRPSLLSQTQGLVWGKCHVLPRLTVDFSVYFYKNIYRNTFQL